MYVCMCGGGGGKSILQVDLYSKHEKVSYFLKI